MDMGPRANTVRPMIRRLRRDDRGMNMPEMVMVIFLLGMFGATFYAVMTGFLRDVFFAEQLGAIERETRPVVDQIVNELRQAVPPDDDVPPLDEVQPEKLGFTSDVVDRTPDAEPEYVQYEVITCGGEVCEMWRRVWYPDASGPGPWTYTLTNDPDIEFRVLDRVVDPILRAVDTFTPIENSGGPVPASPCSGGCVEATVRIEMHVSPLDGGPRNYELYQEVTLRNALP